MKCGTVDCEISRFVVVATARAGIVALLQGLGVVTSTQTRAERRQDDSLRGASAPPTEICAQVSTQDSLSRLSGVLESRYSECGS